MDLNLCGIDVPKGRFGIIWRSPNGSLNYGIASKVPMQEGQSSVSFDAVVLREGADNSLDAPEVSTETNVPLVYFRDELYSEEADKPTCVINWVCPEKKCQSMTVYGHIQRLDHRVFFRTFVGERFVQVCLSNCEYETGPLPDQLPDQPADSA